MENPAISDPAFGKFLEDLKKQNNQSFTTQLLQLKYEREVAKEDNDKREKQLDEVVKALQGVKEAITGNKVSSKSNQSDPLAKKLSSVKVNPDDRTFSEAFKEIKSALTGGTFTAAKGRYSEEFVKAGKGTEEEGMKAYDKIVELEKKLEKSQEYGFEGSKEDREELTKLKDGSVSVANPKVQKRPEGELPATVSSPNAEADNIQSTQEVMADSAKKDVELTGINNELLEKQLKELEKISAALAPSTPSELPEGRLKASRTGHEVAGGGGDGGGGGLGLGDLLPTGGGLGKTLKNVGKGALSLGGKALKFMGGKGGAIAGAALAVGAGAYTAYKGYTAADDSKDAKLKEVQAKVDSGEMKPEEAAAARKEIGNTATVEKSGAVGEGTGMAVGAIAGMKAGAMLGAIGGPLGAGVGALAGGALGAFTGSKGGKYIGEKVGSGINAVKGFFGGKTDDAPGAATKEALAPTPATVKSTTTSSSASFSEAEFAKNDPDNHKRFREFKEKRQEEIAQKDPFFKLDEADARENAESEATDEAVVKFQKEIEASKAGKVKTKTEEKVTGGPGAKNPVVASTAASPVPAIPVIEKKSVDTAAPGKAAAVAIGADTSPKKKGPGPRWLKTLEEYEKLDMTPVDHLDGPNNLPGIKQRYKALAKTQVPLSDSLTSIQILEQGLVDQLQKQMMKERDSKDQPKKSNNKDYDAVMNDPDYQETQREIAELEGKAAKLPTDTVTNPDGSITQKSSGTLKGGEPVPEARAAGGPVEDGADYIVGEKGPELFMPFKDGVVLPNDVSKKIVGGKIPLAKGGVALKDLEGKDLKDFQAYSRTRAQVESIESLSDGGAKDTFADVDPELKTKRDKIMRDNYEAGEKLKARGIDVDAHYNRPDVPAEPKMGEAGYVSLEERYSSKKSKTGSEVNKTSIENIDLSRDASGGGSNKTIVSNNVSSNNNTSYVPIKASPRPDGSSSVDRYQNRIAAY